MSAEQGYQRCREGFAAAGMLYEQALTTLHLAVLLAGEGRASEACRLCGEVSEVFDALGIARESTAASLLREAMEFPKAELLRAVLHCLDREARQPTRRTAASRRPDRRSATPRPARSPPLARRNPVPAEHLPHHPLEIRLADLAGHDPANGRAALDLPQD